MSVIDLAIQRIEREPDNAKVSVEDLLKLALAHVQAGEYKNPKSAIIVIVDEGEGDDSSWTLEGYRCGLHRQEEIGLLEAFKIKQIDKWFGK